MIVHCVIRGWRAGDTFRKRPGQNEHHPDDDEGVSGGAQVRDGATAAAVRSVPRELHQHAQCARCPTTRSRLERVFSQGSSSSRP